MLVQPTSTMSGSFPSFMSVYGTAPKNIYDNASSPERSYQNKAQGFHHFSQPINATNTNTNTHTITHHPPNLIYRRSSNSSIITTSTESSPTTTGSTFDSPLIADAPGSPSSSPESATSAVPPKSFQSAIRSSENSIHTSFNHRPVLQLPQMSPTYSHEDARRNVKNLTLDMKAPSLSRSPPKMGLDGSAHPFSAPTSPLKEGPKTGRRKPTNLSIRTPGFNELTFGKVPNLIPPTPRRKLSQPLSSPSLSSLVSPTTGPLGGMQLALPIIPQYGISDSKTNNSGAVLSNSLPSLREEEYQPPKSQEIQERGYTDGPVLIYDSGVYLYLEPTAEEASKFDTVINVAKEIKDPFQNVHNKNDTVMSVWRNHDSDRRNVIEPQTAISERSFKSAFEWPLATHTSTSTASTPRSSQPSQFQRPEYLHVPWDHNSEIMGELYPLCQLIDDRVAEGKKVLIHCQLGVSRSASLIIAYGLFKGYKKDFHSMYMSVKQRSQWVGPNMCLIYQLTDFLSKCTRGEYANSTKTPDPRWFIHGADNSITPTAKTTILNNNPTNVPPLSITPAVTGNTEELLAISPSIQNQQRHILSPLETPDPLPASQPSDTSNTMKRAASRPLPLREKSRVATQMSIPPHRPTARPGLTFAQRGSFMDLAMQDVPTTPSLISPRATEFSATPFGITTAGDLVSSTPKRVRPPPPGAYPGGGEWRHALRPSMDTTGDFSQIAAHDPRSPIVAEECKEILRQIDDVL